MNWVNHLAVTGLVALQAGPDASHPAGEFLRVQHGFHLAGSILAVAAVVYACVLALLLLTVFQAPGITQRGSERVQSSPYRSLLAGAAAVVVVAFLGVLSQRVGPVIVLFLPVFFMLMVGGIAVVAQDVGRRVFDLGGRSGSRLGRMAAGWAVCLLASSIPYLGWFVIGPILLTMGAGGFVLSLFSRSGEAKADVVLVDAPVASPPATGAV